MALRQRIPGINWELNLVLDYLLFEYIRRGVITYDDKLTAPSRPVQPF